MWTSTTSKGCNVGHHKSQQHQKDYVEHQRMQHQKDFPKRFHVTYDIKYLNNIKRMLRMTSNIPTTSKGSQGI
jgi:hypothetical protein